MEDILILLATQFPVVTTVFLILGGVFTLVELFVKATKTEEDDKKLLQLKNGYIGRIWNFALGFFKKEV